MTVDLEDYFCDLEFSEWEKYESRIVKTTNTLLELFTKYKVTATFFTLGYIAEKFPQLIENIVKNGHEIASHSYSHLDIRKTSAEKFEEDLIRSIKILENISGEKVLGFRAPYFSIDEKRGWAFDIIRKHMKYDSSVFPVKTPLYGIPKAPRFIYRPSKENFLIHDESEDFLELPPATINFPIIGNIPIAGGFHLRFLPYRIIKSGLRKMNKNKMIAVCYIHPKDLDPEMPKIKKYSWHYYYGLDNGLNKFKKLLGDFEFQSVRNVLSIS